VRALLLLWLLPLVSACTQAVTPAPAPILPAATAIVVPSPDRSLAAATPVPAATATPEPPAAATADPTTRPARTPATKVSGARSSAASSSGAIGRESQPAPRPAPALPAGAFLPLGRNCPAEAPIKGTRARVYHSAASRSYATALPVICFVNGAAAEAAGYRPAAN
jgi:hypothetical protein